jgi:hypothetical protein
MTPHVRSFFLFLGGWCACSLLVFLVMADFFHAWDGRIASVRTGEAELPTAQVLIVEDDGDRTEQTWARKALDGIEVPIDRFALPPDPLPPGLARTVKERFALSFTVEPDGAGVRTVATTGPRPLALALLFLFIGTGIRNMIVAGSPFGLRRPEGPRPTVVAAPEKRSEGPRRTGRSKQGPPPTKRRRGQGRRRR